MWESVLYDLIHKLIEDIPQFISFATDFEIRNPMVPFRGFMLTREIKTEELKMYVGNIYF